MKDKKIVYVFCRWWAKKNVCVDDFFSLWIFFCEEKEKFYAKTQSDTLFEDNFGQRKSVFMI